MQISDLKGKYSGRVWLVGNGRSLRETPLELLKDEYSFGMNNIPLYFPETEWRPTFYISTSTIANTFKGYAHQFKIAFMPDFCNDQRFYLLNVDEGEWSDDPSLRVSKWATVMLATIQIAIYIGFTELYLLGCDLGYTDAGNHVIDNYPLTVGFSGEKENRSHRRAHEIAKENCERLGVKLVNCTIGGNLDVHPRMDMRKVLNGRV